MRRLGLPHPPRPLPSAAQVFKLRAFGYTFYFRDEWRRFEWMLVLISLFEQTKLAYAFSEHIYPLPPLLIRLIPALRSLRALRLVQYSKGLQRLASTILASIPSLYNVISLLLLIIYVYSGHCRRSE